MSKLKIGDIITFSGTYYMVVPVKGYRKCQGFNCAYCDMVRHYGRAHYPYKCNLMAKDNKFNCREAMEFGTQFRKIGKGGV